LGQLGIWHDNHHLLLRSLASATPQLSPHIDSNASGTHVPKKKKKNRIYPLLYFAFSLHIQIDRLIGDTRTFMDVPVQFLLKKHSAQFTYLLIQRNVSVYLLVVIYTLCLSMHFFLSGAQ
jgi:hypothetical protein